MSSDASASSSIQIHLRVGCLLVGGLINASLLGVELTGIRTYFKNFKSDWIWFRVGVWMLLVSSLFNYFFSASMLYDYLIMNFGSTSAISRVNYGYAGLIACNSVTQPLAEAFLVWRLYKFSGNTLLCVFNTFLIIGAFVGDLSVFAGVILVPAFEDHSRIMPYVIACLALNAIADAAISLSLVYSLKGFRTYFESTNSVVSAIIASALETGLASTLLSLASLVCLLLWPHTNLFLMFCCYMGRIYSLSMIANLNSRIKFRTLVESQDGGSSARTRSTSQGSSAADYIFTKAELDNKRNGAAEGMVQLNDIEANLNHLDKNPIAPTRNLMSPCTPTSGDSASSFPLTPGTGKSWKGSGSEFVDV